jgi:hypothetical protein
LPSHNYSIQKPKKIQIKKVIMKKYLFYLLAGLVIAFSGCKEEYAPPVVTAPASANIEVSKAVDVTFQFTAEAGFASATATATGGTATIKTNGTVGSASGSVVVTFTAGTAIGAGSVVLKVTDAEGQFESATAVLSLFEKGAPLVTPPASTNVEQLKSVDITFSFTSEAGYKSAASVVTGGTAVIKTQPAANATTGSVVVTFTAARSVGAGSVTLTVTDINNKAGQSVGVMSVIAQPTISVNNNITANTTWETGKTYVLEGRIAVTDGITLTIQPGVVVKGREGSGPNATALLIARGGKIMAEGTAASPIIFTSIADQLLPGEIASPNLAPTLNGLWGGLLILGKAPISAAAEAVQIEGIPVSDPNGLYGGTEPADNSGSVKYVSIRHGGANIGEGNEINGLTLGGVGSATVIENVEIIGNQDDGVEYFGGTVNVKNMIIWNPGDDGVDTDQSWAGTLDNFIVIAGPDTDHSMEIDGPEGTLIAGNNLINGSLKGANNEIADFRSSASGSFSKIYCFNFPDPALPLGASAGEGDLSLDPTSLPNFTGGSLTFSDLQVVPATGVALEVIFRNGTHVHATAVTPATKTVGADKTKFSGWSWASVANQLTDF